MKKQSSENDQLTLILFFFAPDPKSEKKSSKSTNKQEMSQSRDECLQRNWSSIRHIGGKLTVI